MLRCGQEVEHHVPIRVRSRPPSLALGSGHAQSISFVGAGRSLSLHARSELDCAVGLRITQTRAAGTRESIVFCVVLNLNPNLSS